MKTIVVKFYLPLKGKLYDLEDDHRQYCITSNNFLMAIKYTLDDMPGDRANCGTCTYRGPGCVRMRKDLKEGVRNSCTCNIDGYVYRCTYYEGKFM